MQEKNQEAINNFAAFQGAIPGQSLTNDPDQKYPWEQPPRITNQQEALDYMTSEILEEENLFSQLNNSEHNTISIDDQNLIP